MMYRLVGFAGFRAVKPAVAGVVVVGAGIDHAVGIPVKLWGRYGLLALAVKGELQDLHARQPQPVAQGFHVRGDFAQVFGDQGQVPEPVLENGQKNPARVPEAISR